MVLRVGCGFAELEPAGAEEVREPAAALLSEDAGGDLDAVVELRVIEDGENGAAGTGFEVRRGVDETRDAGVEDGAGAHGTGLEGADEGAAALGSQETIVAEGDAGGAKGDDLGVSRGIGGSEDLVVAAAKDSLGIRSEDDGTDRNLAGEFGGAGFGEGEVHGGEVGQ